MCSKWASLPVNRLPTTQTENMYSFLRAAALNHWLACFKMFSTLTGFYWKKKVRILPYSSEQADAFFIYCMKKHCRPFTRFFKKKIKKKSQKRSSLVCRGINWLAQHEYHVLIHLLQTLDYLSLYSWANGNRTAMWLGFSNSFTNLDSCHDKLKD